MSFHIHGIVRLCSLTMHKLVFYWQVTGDRGSTWPDENDLTNLSDHLKSHETHYIYLKQTGRCYFIDFYTSYYRPNFMNRIALRTNVTLCLSRLCTSHTSPAVATTLSRACRHGMTGGGGKFQPATIFWEKVTSLVRSAIHYVVVINCAIRRQGPREPRRIRLACLSRFARVW